MTTININVTVAKENIRAAGLERTETIQSGDRYISRILLHEYLLFLSYRGFVTIFDVIKAGYNIKTFFQLNKELRRKGWNIRKRRIDGIAHWSLEGLK